MQCDILCKIYELAPVIRTVVLGHIWLADDCDVLFKTLVKITWKWVIYYTADAIKSQYR
jgi:hypothetical protein